jgi:hypothetical protein
MLAALVLAGCASRSETSGTDASAASDGSGDVVNFIGISAVEGADGRTLTVNSEPLPTDASAAGCAVEATPRAQETPYEVIVYIDLMGDVGDPPYFEGCAVEERSMTVPLADPIADRRVTDAFGSIFWQRDGRWTGCDQVVMTCVTDPASCDNGTLRDTIANADVPRHFGMDTRCEEPYAVVDVDIGAGACPADDTGPNPCAGERIRRMYWRIEDGAWVEIGVDQGRGCGDVLETAPDFPTHLCADLPPVPTSGD